MCLISNWRLPRLTLRPITCYKVMNVLKRKKSLVSKYWGDKEYVFEKTYKATSPTHNILSSILYTLKDGGVYENFFHSYALLQDAYDNETGCYCVIECVIPRFTWYYKGESSEYEPQYASRKIKFVRVLDSKIIKGEYNYGKIR